MDIASFSDDDLRKTLRQALQWIFILLLVAIPIVWLACGWRNLVLFTVGALVSATGVWEWQRLLHVLIAKMDESMARTEADAKPRVSVSAGPVVAMFSLRLVLAAGVLYVSLKCCNGSVYALLAGLALSIVALAIQAARLL